jgi:predicted NBD/HSP70 family sugar kinase
MVANSPELRERNLGLVLTDICQAPAGRPPSRSQVARRTGLHKTTVSQLTDELIGAGLVIELDAVATGGQAGRPSLPLAPAPGRLVALGLEVNVDHFGLKAIDLAGDVLAERLETGNLRGSDPGAVLDRLADQALDVAARLRRNGSDLAGAELALPGFTSSGATGTELVHAPNLGWHGLDLTSFEARLGLPLLVDNEANLAARAEVRLAGPSPQERSFVYLSAEAGIGGGLVIDGTMLVGSRGWAGEVGHVTVNPTGRLCTCGARGCLETYAGRRAIARAVGLPESAGPEAILERIVAVGAPEAVLAGFSGVVENLATALTSILNLVDVSQVVLGGDYAILSPALAPPLRQALSGRLLAARWGGIQVAVRGARAGSTPAMTGAAWSVLETVLANPVPHLG